MTLGILSEPGSCDVETRSRSNSVLPPLPAFLSSLSEDKLCHSRRLSIQQTCSSMSGSKCSSRGEYADSDEEEAPKRGSWHTLHAEELLVQAQRKLAALEQQQQQEIAEQAKRSPVKHSIVARVARIVGRYFGKTKSAKVDERVEARSSPQPLPSTSQQLNMGKEILRRRSTSAAIAIAGATSRSRSGSNSQQQQQQQQQQQGCKMLLQASPAATAGTIANAIAQSVHPRDLDSVFGSTPVRSRLLEITGETHNEDLYMFLLSYYRFGDRNMPFGQRLSLASTMIDRFICVDSSLCINISGAMRKGVIKEFNDIRELNCPDDVRPDQELQYWDDRLLRLFDGAFNAIRRSVVELIMTHTEMN
jgi:hypothetical protein